MTHIYSRFLNLVSVPNAYAAGIFNASYASPHTNNEEHFFATTRHEQTTPILPGYTQRHIQRHGYARWYHEHVVPLLRASRSRDQISQLLGLFDDFDNRFGVSDPHAEPQGLRYTDITRYVDSLRYARILCSLLNDERPINMQAWHHAIVTFLNCSIHQGERTRVTIDTEPATYLETAFLEATAQLTSEDEIHAWNVLATHHIQPTKYLARQLGKASEKDTVIASWLGTMGLFRSGHFDSANELHRNLEYTHFCRLVSPTWINPYDKKIPPFAEYEAIFSNGSLAQVPSFDRTDEFEVRCQAYESQLLLKFITHLKQTHPDRPLWIIPNLSNGILYTMPILHALSEQGIRVNWGSKVGSTQKREHTCTMEENPFQHLATDILQEQPLIVIVDGTRRLAPRHAADKPIIDTIRFPHARWDFLNHVIALNDAMGFADLSYTSHGKKDASTRELRDSHQFIEFVRLYQEIIAREQLSNLQPFEFLYWNTAGIRSIADDHDYIHAKVPAMSAMNASVPAIIFASIGVPHTMIPASITQAFPELTHQPSRFEDDNRTFRCTFQFGHNRFGVHSTNILHEALQRAAGSPSIVRLPEHVLGIG